MIQAIGVNWKEAYYFDLASVETSHSSFDTLKEENLIKELPQLFKTIRGQKPTEEEMRNLSALAKNEPVAQG